MGIGDGDWGLGIGPNPQSPIPNPQSPIPPSPSYINVIVFMTLIYSLTNFSETFTLQNKNYKNTK